jgi:hypothetical protein
MRHREQRIKGTVYDHAHSVTQGSPLYKRGTCQLLVAVAIILFCFLGGSRFAQSVIPCIWRHVATVLAVGVKTKGQRTGGQPVNLANLASGGSHIFSGKLKITLNAAAESRVVV